MKLEMARQIEVNIDNDKAKAVYTFPPNPA